MEDKKTPAAYRAIRWLVRLFSPHYRMEGTENLPDGPCVIVGNHSQMYGPIAGELYIPGPHYVWCIGEMMHREEVAEYAYRDFWSLKPRRYRWLYRLLSREGNRLVIFPEHYVPRNNIVHDFQERFVDVARMYYRKTGRELSFVPMYVAPRLRSLTFGTPVVFRADAPIAEERSRICGELMNAITRTAVSLPEHTVVPYPNIPKRDYPKNRPLEVFRNEETAV